MADFGRDDNRDYSGDTYEIVSVSYGFKVVFGDVQSAQTYDTYDEAMYARNKDKLAWDESDTREEALNTSPIEWEDRKCN